MNSYDRTKEKLEELELEYIKLKKDLDYYKKLCNQFSQIINVKELKKLVKLINENHLLKELDAPIDGTDNYGRKF